MRIFGWMADTQGCGAYRIAFPLWTLKQQGHDATYAEKMPDSVLFDGAADVIVGQRVCLPGPTKSWQRLAAEGHSKLVFEVDDDLLGVDQSNKPAFALFSQPEIRQNLISNITVADLVTTTNEHLAELLSQYNPNVAVLGNYVPEWTLTHERPESPCTVIGWGGGVSHSRDFGEVAKPLRSTLQKHHDDVVFHNIGVDHTDRVRSIKGNTVFTPWYKSVEEYLSALDFDIGIAPLRTSSFNDSKSYVKALEYASLGIPCVVSNTGPYPDFVQHGLTGFLAANAKEWAEYLTVLVKEPERRAQMGKRARELAAEHTIEKNAWRWAEAYSRI